MGCCCSAASWKEEQVQDYKFSYIDIDQFILRSFYYRIKYLFLFLSIMKGILVYFADIYTVIDYLAFNGFENNPGIDILQGNGQAFLVAAKWIYLGSIFVSLLILLFETKKARKITKSGYISSAFTNTMSYRQYAISSFAHYSFFQRIEMYKRPIDRVAFFVFFSLKDYKRLILGQLPRRIIDGFFVYIATAECGNILYKTLANKADIAETAKCFQGKLPLTLGVKAFTLFLFAITCFQFLIAIIMYVPLVMRIRGNLKEYCAFKIDKRIAQLLRRHKKMEIEKVTAVKVDEAEMYRQQRMDPFGTKISDTPLPVVMPSGGPTLPKLPPLSTMNSYHSNVSSNFSGTSGSSQYSSGGRRYYERYHGSQERNYNNNRYDDNDNDSIYSQHSDRFGQSRYSDDDQYSSNSGRSPHSLHHNGPFEGDPHRPQHYSPPDGRWR